MTKLALSATILLFCAVFAARAHAQGEAPVLEAGPGLHLSSEVMPAALGAGPGGSAFKDSGATAPLYVILGDVQSAGSYPWTNGLTVQDALERAGGLLITPAAGDTAGSPELDRAKAREAYEISLIAYYAAVARKTRLIAQRDQLEVMPLPDELLRLRHDPTVAEIMEGEQRTLDIQRTTRLAEIDGLKRQIELYTNEIRELNSQLARLREAGRVLEQERGMVKQLQEKGLMRLPQLLSVERSILEQKVRERDISIDIIRAKQRIIDLEIDVLRLEKGNTVEVMQDLQLENENVAKLAREMAGAREMLSLRVRQSFENLNRIGGFGGITITRHVAGAYQEIRANADSIVLSGDIVTIAGLYDPNSLLRGAARPGASSDY